MIEVREARLEDLDAIVSLMDQLKRATSQHDAVTTAGVRTSLQTMLRFPEIYRNYLAVENEEVLGVVSLLLYKTLLHAGGTALINELVVAEEARGRGIGRKLVEAAAAAAREQGMDEIEVGTEVENYAARGFYRSVGFHRGYVLIGMDL
jgi:ribosomal protein S18 acetylase RimI-like enzyme